MVILDGLDWQVYQGQGLLEDLSSWVDTQSLVSNIAAPFIGEDGSVYALPARFAVPVLVGTASDLAAASSLKSLSRWLLEKAWNAIEKPMMFLQDKSNWPLSLYLSGITVEDLGFAIVASLMMLAPPLLLFLVGRKYLEGGIGLSAQANDGM